MEVSQERLRQCRAIFRKGIVTVSTFRSDSELAMVSLLAVAYSPEFQFRRAMEAYALLRQYFWGSEYLVIAVMVIAEMVEPDKYEVVSARAKQLYEQMEKRYACPHYIKI